EAAYTARAAEAESAVREAIATAGVFGFYAKMFEAAVPAYAAEALAALLADLHALDRQAGAPDSTRADTFARYHQISDETRTRIGTAFITRAASPAWLGDIRSIVQKILRDQGRLDARVFAENLVYGEWYVPACVLPMLLDSDEAQARRTLEAVLV